MQVTSHDPRGKKDKKDGTPFQKLSKVLSGKRSSVEAEPKVQDGSNILDFIPKVSWLFTLFSRVCIPWILTHQIRRKSTLVLLYCVIDLQLCSRHSWTAFSASSAQLLRPELIDRFTFDKLSCCISIANTEHFVGNVYLSDTTTVFKRLYCSFPFRLRRAPNAEPGKSRIAWCYSAISLTASKPRFLQEIPPEIVGLARGQIVPLLDQTQGRRHVFNRCTIPGLALIARETSWVIRLSYPKELNLSPYTK